MATKKTTRSKSASGKKKSSTTRSTSSKRSSGSRKSSSRRQTVNVEEPMPARALQSLILVAGVMLLFAVFFGGRWGPAMVGLLVFGSAFPPVRRHVDKWLVGKVRGEEANEAAVIRMGIGAVIVAISLMGVFVPG